MNKENLLKRLRTIKEDHLGAVNELDKISKGEGSCSTSVMKYKHTKEAFVLEIIERLLLGIDSKATYNMIEELAAGLNNSVKATQWIPVITGELQEGVSIYTILKNRKTMTYEEVLQLVNRRDMEIDESGIIHELPSEV